MNSVAGHEFHLLVRSVEDSPRNAAAPESLPRRQFCPSLGSWLTTVWKPWPFWGMREPKSGILAWIFFFVFVFAESKLSESDRREVPAQNLMRVIHNVLVATSCDETGPRVQRRSAGCPSPLSVIFGQMAETIRTKRFWMQKRGLDMRMPGLRLLLLAMAGLAVLPPLAGAQSRAASGASTSTAVLSSPGATHPQLAVTYARPTEKTKLHNYFFDAFGPYPIIGAALAGGINQADHTPPEWKQGARGYGQRFASDLGIAAISTTTRYALAEAFRQDTLYYRCQCKGVFPRLGHAVISTFTGRRGDSGDSVFSFPALVAPYAGTMTAVYGWYPRRYDAKDAFRMGNYTVLGYVGGNIAMEFLYGGPHAWLSRMRLPKGRRAPSPGSNP
jgi:hypothetical protein